MSDPDVLVVGGGSAGLSFAKEAAGLGARVVLAEPGPLGGTCVNRGCVPKKLMWTAARALHEVAALQGGCVVGPPPRLDWEALARRRDARVSALRDGQADALAEAGVTLRPARATLRDDRSAVLDDAPEAPVRAGAVVWAAGAGPVRPDFPGADLGEVSDDVFAWRAQPRRLLILGGGYIGCEFAAIFAAFGTEVVLVDRAERLLGGFAPMLSDLVAEHLRAAGVEVRLGAGVEALSREDGELAAAFDRGPAQRFERVLLAVGRAANAGGPVERFGLATSDIGAVCVDDRFSPGVEGLHVVGDAADRLPLTPVATADGTCLARQMFGEGEDPLPLEHVARAAFTLPPVAQVGALSGAEGARFSPLGQAVMERAPPEGWALAEGPDGALSGVALVGESAHEAIGWAARAVAAGCPREVLARSRAVHPSAAEEPLG